MKGTLEPFIYAVGDIAPDRPDPAQCLELIRGELRTAAWCFGQLETSLTSLGTRLPQARHAVRATPGAARNLADAGFGVISCAGNHCMDWGSEALLDTIDHLRAAGIDVVGAGANIREARRPVLRQVGGKNVAWLAYSSILPQAYWAEERRAGCVPLRVHTVYEQVEHDQPGTPARIRTFAHQDDLAAMCADIRSARECADVVLVSMHWGIHFIPAVIADYQRVAGRAAIDAGADAVIGHHAHLLKGIELHRDRPIFYSIGNFAVDLKIDEAHAQSPSFKEVQKLNPRWIPDFGSLYNFPEESRATLLVKVDLPLNGPVRFSAVPAWINRSAQPRRVWPGEGEFEDVAYYVNAMCREAGLNARLKIAGDGFEILPVTG